MLDKYIGIDCFKLVKGEGASIGIYNYTKNLVENLLSLKQFNIIIFGNEFNKSDFDLEGLTFVDINIKRRNKFTYIVWEMFLVNHYIKKYNINLIIFPRGYIPLFSVAKTINIIHDLIPMYYYENYRNDIDYLENFYIRKRLLYSIKHSDTVVTISNYSKDEIKKYVHNSNQISVIHNGYNKLEKNNLCETSEKYIVAVTSDKYKHKNLKNIIETYICYFNKIENPMKLHLIGVENLKQFDLEEKIYNNIIIYGFISDSEYIKIIQNARIFLFLSLIEGFGFPPLEAMNLGVPVICSNKTSLYEVVSDGGELVEPSNANYIAEKIIKIDTDELYRNKLVLNGYQNLKRFKWSDIIQKYASEINIMA